MINLLETNTDNCQVDKFPKLLRVLVEREGW